MFMAVLLACDLGSGASLQGTRIATLDRPSSSAGRGLLNWTRIGLQRPSYGFSRPWAGFYRVVETPIVDCLVAALRARVPVGGSGGRSRAPKWATPGFSVHVDMLLSG